MRNLLVSLFGICTLSAQTPDPLVAVDYEAQQQWVDSTYGQLSFDEKIGQLFMVMAFSEQGKEHFDAISKNIDENKIGEARGGGLQPKRMPSEESIWQSAYLSSTAKATGHNRTGPSGWG